MRTKVRIQSTSALLKRWWERLEKRWMATESGGDDDRVRRGRDGDENGDETGDPRNETSDKTAVTAGDKRDGDDRGVMYTDEGKLEFDEDEMTALEGQRLFAEFICGIY